jgi:hypothetical protein
MEHQLAGTKSAKLNAARAAYVAKHEDFLVGPVAAHLKSQGRGGNDAPLQLEWRLGFIHAARLDMAGYEPDEEPEDILKKLLALPAARFLSQLTIGMAGNMFDGENSYDKHLRVLSSLKEPPPLRSLVVGDFSYPDDCEISWARLGSAAKLWGAYPGLHVLRFQGGQLKLGDVKAPELISLEIRSGGLNREAVRSIAAATWPKLRSLVLWTGDPDYGGDATIKDVQPILDGKAFPALRYLSLKNCMFADDVAAAIVRSRVLAQLEVLDLSMGALTQEGARALAANASALAHLSKIDVSDCVVPDADARALKKALRRAEVHNQREPRDYMDLEEGQPDRYVAVGE